MKPVFPLLAFALVLVAGCSSGQGRADLSTGASARLASSPAAMEKAGAKAETASFKAAPEVTTEAPRKIISTGTVTLDTADLDASGRALEALATRFGGYIGDASRDGTRGEERRGSWTLRIPSARFDAFLAELPKIGELQSSSRTAQDVSEEFYDAEARLRNKRVEEARLVELLKRVAGNLDQILRVETELSRVRGEIESVEGRLRFLSYQSDLSTVTVTLREVRKFVPVGPPTLGTRVGRTFRGSVEALGELGAGLLLLAVALAPWVLPLAFVGAVALAIWRGRRRGRGGPGIPPVQG